MTKKYRRLRQYLRCAVCGKELGGIKGAKKTCNSPVCRKEYKRTYQRYHYQKYKSVYRTRLRVWRKRHKKKRSAQNRDYYYKRKYGIYNPPESNLNEPSLPKQ